MMAAWDGDREERCTRPGLGKDVVTEVVVDVCVSSSLTDDELHTA